MAGGGGGLGGRAPGMQKNFRTGEGRYLDTEALLDIASGSRDHPDGIS